MKQVEQSIENKENKKRSSNFSEAEWIGNFGFTEQKIQVHKCNKNPNHQTSKKNNVMQFTNEKQFLNFRDMMEKVMRIWNDVALY